MRLTTFLMTTLLIMLFATVGFCEDGKLLVKNAADMPRVVKVKASVPTGYISKESFILGNGKERTVNITLQRTVEYTETWHVKILDVTGIPICDGYLLRSSKGFSLKTPGAYFTYQNVGKDAVVTITK